MISEPFASGNSIIHGLDPRIRVVAATVYCFVVAFSNQLPVLLIALGISSALTISAGLEIKAVGKRLAIVNGLILLLWVVVPLTSGGQPLFQFGPLSISRAGIMLATRITLKSNAILLSMIALIATMKFATLGYALKQLRVPQKITQLLLMNYRYIFVLEQEYQRLIRAAKIRGFQPKTNLHTYRTYAYVVGMLLVRATSRAHRVHQAMLCRGFKGTFYTLQDYRADSAELIFSVLMACLIIVLVLLEWW